MLGRNVEIVEKLPSEKFIIKIEQKVIISGTSKVASIIKFTIADKNGLINITNLNGDLCGIQFFDKYSLNENGDIIIGIKKVYEEFNYGLINREGVLVSYPFYDSMEFGNEDTCIVGRFLYTMSYGYIDIMTGKAITPICFREANKFYDNRAAVRFCMNYGYIDRNKVVNDPKNIEEYAEDLYPKFFKATDFNNGSAYVRLSVGIGHLAQIDKNGRIIGCISEKEFNDLALVRKKD